ncbi:MAG: hypothetical protein AAB250_03440 [Bdellovibrionota bacterium]
MEAGMSSSSGYKIIYRFTLKPGVWNEFIGLQRQAHAIYSKHVPYQLEFVRSEVDPDDVMEIQTYASQGDAKKTENLHEAEPDLARLFQSFLVLLDPAKGSIETIVGESIDL